MAENAKTTVVPLEQGKWVLLGAGPGRFMIGDRRLDVSMTLSETDPGESPTNNVYRVSGVNEELTVRETGNVWAKLNAGAGVSSAQTTAIYFPAPPVPEGTTEAVSGEALEVDPSVTYSAKQSIGGLLKFGVSNGVLMSLMVNALAASGSFSLLLFSQKPTKTVIEDQKPVDTIDPADLKYYQGYYKLTESDTQFGVVSNWLRDIHQKIEVAKGALYVVLLAEDSVQFTDPQGLSVKIGVQP